MFYDNYLKLCNSIGKSPTAVAEEIGIYRSTVSRWKNGKSQTDANIQKVADYFGVTVQELKSDDKIKSPTPERVELLDEPNKKALIEYVLKKNFTDGQAKAVLSFIKQYEEGGD